MSTICISHRLIALPDRAYSTTLGSGLLCWQRFGMSQKPGRQTAPAPVAGNDEALAPITAMRLAEAVGMDKGQISRALAELVSRKLVAKEVNPRDNRETLVCLTKAGLAAHDTIVAGAQERNRRLLEQLSRDELAALLDQIDRLTDTAATMLADEKDLN
jgi:DNA-binding MarR family transcriptional regulator